MNPKGKKINLFTNGIDDIFINNIKNEKTINKNWEKDKPLLITYAGNIGYGQGFEHTLIHIAHYFREKIKFNIIGDGSSVGIIESQIKDKKLENITLSKPVNRIQLINLYKNSDVLFLQLNNVKAFEKVLPSKIFEYASFNKPILAGVNGVAREFLGKG